MATWPANVPAPSLDGYSYDPKNLQLSTEMSAGLPRDRRISIAKIGDVTFSFKCTNNQAAEFESWFYDVSGANAGAAWFEMKIKVPAGTSNRMCKFIGTYKSVPLSHDRWQFSGVLRVTYA